MTHSLSLSASSVTLECGELALGTTARIVLSFPRLVAPFELEARVCARTPDDGPGRSASTTFEVVSASPRAQEVLIALALLASHPPEAAETGQFRCLLVEDNGLIRDLFAYGLEKYSRARRTEVALELAGDADEAWRMLTAEHFDMAIVDHYLPTKNGAELIARMRGEPRLAQMPIVAISVGGSEARAAALEAGADLFLDKPIVMRDLFTTLDRLSARQERRP